MRLVTQWDGGPGGWEAGRQVGWQPVRSERLRWCVLVVVVVVGRFCGELEVQ